MEQRLLLSLAEAHHLLRHDINNHLQVILGYMQLQKPEKAQEYLERTIKSLQRFNFLAKINLPLLQTFLLSFLTGLGEQNDALYVQVEKDMKDWREYDLVLTRFFMDILTPFRELCLKKELSCRISFSYAPEQKIEMYLQSKKDIMTDKLVFLHNLSGNYQGLQIEIAPASEEKISLTIFRDVRWTFGHDINIKK